MRGLFRIKNDPNFAAAYIDEGECILFPGKDGRAYRDKPQVGSLNDLSEEAGLTQTGDSTLLEAVSAFREGRKPRWEVNEIV